MKRMILITVLFLLASTTFAAEIECQNTRAVLNFHLIQKSQNEDWHGEGVYGYDHFRLYCRNSTNKRQLKCEGGAAHLKKVVVISIDEDDIITATVRYGNQAGIKTGCIIRY